MMAIANLPLPDPHRVPMEGKYGKLPSVFPQEIMVFPAHAKRGVGQGKT